MKGKSKTKMCIVAFAILYLIAITVLSPGCERKEKEKTLCVATDIHVIASSAINDENYATYAARDKAVHISDAVFNGFIDSLDPKVYDYLFLCGDLTEQGDEESHRAVASALKKAEDKGIEVFVINGNHDVQVFENQIGVRADPELFKSVYHDFGYDKAIATYDKGLSYVADFGERYRLIAIDDIGYYLSKDEYKEGISDEHRLWIYEQVERSVADGKETVVMAHKPFLTHLPEATELVDDGNLEVQFKHLTEFFAEKNVEVIFAGHEHINDVKERKYVKGETTTTVTEVSTGSMAYIDVPYRKVKLKEDEYEVEIESVERVNQDFLPKQMTAEEKAELTGKGVVKYVNDRVYADIYKTVSSLGYDGGKLDIKVPEQIKEFYEIVKKDVINPLMNAPLRQKDEKEGETSLERVLNDYGIELPTADYSTTSDLAVTAVFRLAHGDEHYSEKELKLIEYIMMWAFDLFGKASDKIATAYPTLPKIAINSRQVFVDGILECYDSGIVPFALRIGETALDGKIKPNDFGGLGKIIINELSGNGELGQSLSLINSNKLVINVINSLTMEKFVGFEKFVGDRSIELRSFIEDGLFERYIADFVDDAAPNDRSVEIKITREHKEKENED